MEKSILVKGGTVLNYRYIEFVQLFHKLRVLWIQMSAGNMWVYKVRDTVGIGGLTVEIKEWIDSGEVLDLREFLLPDRYLDNVKIIIGLIKDTSEGISCKKIGTNLYRKLIEIEKESNE